MLQKVYTFDKFIANGYNIHDVSALSEKTMASAKPILSYKKSVFYGYMLSVT